MKSFTSLLPYNATKFERDVENAIKYKIDASGLAGFKFSDYGNLRLSLIWEYSLAQVNIDDLKTKITEGLKFHRLAGTPYSLRLALSWYDLNDITIEEEEPGEHFAEFQVGFKEIPDGFAINTIINVAEMAKPLRSRLTRMYNEDYDIRRFILDSSDWGDLLSDHSGTQIYEDSSKLSFGRKMFCDAKLDTYNTLAYKQTTRVTFAKFEDTFKLDFGRLDDTKFGEPTEKNFYSAEKQTQNTDRVGDKIPDQLIKLRTFSRAMIVLSESILEDGQSKLTLLTNNLGAFSREVGASLIPALNSIVDSINSVLNPIMNWMQQNKELTKTITTGIAGLIGFRIAAFALGYAATFLFGGWNKIVILFKGLRLALPLLGAAFRSFLGWPMALATAALLIWDNWDAVKNFFLKIWDSVEPYWNSFKQLMDEYGITDGIVSAWTSVKEFFGSIWDSVFPYWDAFANKMKEWGVVDGIISAWTRVKDFFLKIWNSVSPIIDKIVKPISGLWDGAKSGLQKVGSLFQSDKTTTPALKIPQGMKPANSVTRNQNNNFSITINANKNDSSEAIANKVMNRVQDHSRTFLYDEVTEAI